MSLKVFRANYWETNKGSKRRKADECNLKDRLLRKLQRNSNILDVVSEFVETHKDKELTFRVKQRFKLHICGFDGTFYMGDQHMMSYWQNLYLPNPTKMVVFGVMEDVPCLAPAQQLVILVAEDEKVYAYEEEELHLVGESVQEFLHEGLRLFKQSVSYRCGQGLESGVLHAIFFFGWIHKPQVKPEEFLSVDHQDSFQKRFPKPFAQYKTHLPTQTPYSILLDYVTEEIDVVDPVKLMHRLTTINADMLKLSADNSQLTPSTFFFIATVVAHSCYRGPQDTANHAVFFGASLSCKGKTAKLIMIYLSCIKTWHGAVASAVLSPETGSATVFSDQVSCQAYQIKGNDYIRKPPCEKCHEIFENVTFDPPFKDPQNAVWDYGNCAETEALSKLLWHYPDAATGQLTNENREIIEKRLISELRSSNFLVNTLEYFQAE